MPSYSIFPSAPRARLLDDRMRRQLCESFEVLSDCFDPKTIPEVAALNRFIAKFRQGYQPSPIDYGRHYELATATNPESDLFPSPLRRDPRPMDGIYHAANVWARMALTMDCVASASFLSEDIRDEARRLRDEDLVNFQKGAAVVRAAANMTATGHAIFADAETAMQNLVKTIAAGSQNG